MSNELHPSGPELQRQINEGREATKELRNTVAGLTSVVQKLEVTLATLSERIAVTNTCPKPGACLSLEEDVDRLSEDIQRIRDEEIKEVREMMAAMKSELDERRGERTVIGLICTAVGSLIGALVSAWVSSRV